MKDIRPYKKLQIVNRQGKAYIRRKPVKKAPRVMESTVIQNRPAMGGFAHRKTVKTTPLRTYDNWMISLFGELWAKRVAVGIIGVIVLGIVIGAFLDSKVVLQITYVDPITRIEAEVKKVVEPTKAEAKTEPKVLGASTSNITEMIKAKFGEHANSMLACLKGENGGQKPRAVFVNRNKSQDIGIFMINTPLHCGKVGEKDVDTCRERLKDAKTNIDVGYKIFSGREYGFTSWLAPTCKPFYVIKTK